MSPPERAASPGWGSGEGDRITLDGTISPKDATHDPELCATCLRGVRPWTPERREAAASYAATSGRRIDHLPHGERSPGPLEDVLTRFHPDWKREDARV